MNKSTAQNVVCGVSGNTQNKKEVSNMRNEKNKKANSGVSVNTQDNFIYDPRFMYQVYCVRQIIENISDEPFMIFYLENNKIVESGIFSQENLSNKPQYVLDKIVDKIAKSRCGDITILYSQFQRCEITLNEKQYKLFRERYSENVVGGFSLK